VTPERRGELAIWDLRKIIAYLTARFPSILEIYLFGSRGYQTGSLRSDIDILAYSPDPLELREGIGIIDEIPPLDVFRTVDKRTAESLANGSRLNLRYPQDSLITQLDAILLWNSIDGLSKSFENWDQATLAHIKFEKTVASTPSTRWTWIRELTPLNRLALVDVLFDIRDEIQRNGHNPSIAILPPIVRFRDLFPADSIDMRDAYGRLRLMLARFGGEL
jgi:predicted nucleotidyltransferase